MLRSRILPTLLAGLLVPAISLADDPNVTVRDGLAKQVVGPHFKFRILAREVIFPIRLDIDREVRQIITTDPNVVGGLS